MNRSLMGVRPGARLLAPFLALLLVVAACTDADDSGDDDSDGDEAQPEEVDDSASIPPQGMRLAIVVPSTDEIDEPLQQVLLDDLQGLEQTSGIRQLRVDVATGHEFVSDLAQVHAERGFDLVCVFGGQAPLVVTELADQYRGVEFCAPSPSLQDEDEADGAIDVEGDEPVGSWPGALGVRAEELGHVVGVAARVASEGELVGLVLAGDDIPRFRFESGLHAGLADNPFIPISSGGDTMADRAREAVDEGAEVVVIDGGPGATQAVAEIAGEVVVLAPQAVADEAGGGVLVTWNVDWAAVLEVAVAQVVGPEDAERVQLGLDEGVFGIESDPSVTSEEVGEDVERAIRVASRELIAGERVAALDLDD